MVSDQLTFTPAGDIIGVRLEAVETACRMLGIEGDAVLGILGGVQECFRVFYPRKKG